MGASAARPLALPVSLSGYGHPLSLRECPRRPLTPSVHLYPAISGPLPSWGSDPWALGGSHWPQLWETRRLLCPILPTAKIPLLFCRQGATPLRLEEQGGGPQVVPLVRAVAGWFLAKLRGLVGAGLALPPKDSLGGNVHNP